MSIKPFFLWRDFWIGFYYDNARRILYICPVPMFGLRIQFARKPASIHYETIREDDTPILKVSELRNGVNDAKRKILYGTLDEWKEFNRDDPC